MNQLAHAIAFAAHAHRNQTDKGKEPYILHPLRVMQAMRRAKYPGTIQVIAVLHDVMEDTDTQWKALRREFGVIVESAVDALTRRYEEHPNANGRFLTDEFGAKLWGAPKETHWEYFERCVRNNAGRVVKYYDTSDNMDPARFHPEVPYKRYIKVLNWYKEQKDLRIKQAEHGIVS